MKKLLFICTLAATLCAGILHSMEVPQPDPDISQTGLSGAYIPQELKKLIIHFITHSNNLDEAVAALNALRLTNKEFKNILDNDVHLFTVIVHLLAKKFSPDAPIKISEAEQPSEKMDLEPKILSIPEIVSRFNTPAATKYIELAHKLISATKEGNHEAISSLINQGAEVNYNDSKNNKLTALIAAITNYDADGVQQLLNAGANPNLAGTNQRTPLLWAIYFAIKYQNNTKIVADMLAIIQQLLNAGANPNRKEPEREITDIQALFNHPQLFNRVMQSLAQEHKISTDEIAKKFNIETGYADLGYQLFRAITESNADRVAELIAQGADANFSMAHPMSGYDTPLLYAVMFREYEIINMLLEAGANPHFKNNMGTTLDNAKMYNAPLAIQNLLINAMKKQ